MRNTLRDTLAVATGHVYPYPTLEESANSFEAYLTSAGIIVLDHPAAQGLRALQDFDRAIWSIAPSSDALRRSLASDFLTSLVPSKDRLFASAWYNSQDYLRSSGTSLDCSQR